MRSRDTEVGDVFSVCSMHFMFSLSVISLAYHIPAKHGNSGCINSIMSHHATQLTSFIYCPLFIIIAMMPFFWGGRWSPFRVYRSYTPIAQLIQTLSSSTPDWPHALSVLIGLFCFQSLLSDPNPNSPANSMAAQLYKENRREYEKRVRMCVEQSFVD